jgi:hypothetical protein
MKIVNGDCSEALVSYDEYGCFHLLNPAEHSAVSGGWSTVVGGSYTAGPATVEIPVVQVSSRVDQDPGAIFWPPTAVEPSVSHWMATGVAINGAPVVRIDNTACGTNTPCPQINALCYVGPGWPP